MAFGRVEFRETYLSDTRITEGVGPSVAIAASRASPRTVGWRAVLVVAEGERPHP